MKISGLNETRKFVQSALQMQEFHVLTYSYITAIFFIMTVLAPFAVCLQKTTTFSR